MRTQRTVARVLAVLAATVALAATATVPAYASDGVDRASSDRTVEPQGGCVLGVCGTVINESSSYVMVTMNWCCTDNRILNAGARTNGWGDVDGVFIYSGHVATVDIVSVRYGYRREYWYGPQWFKIATDDTADIRSQ